VLTGIGFLVWGLAGHGHHHHDHDHGTEGALQHPEDEQRGHIHGHHDHPSQEHSAAPDSSLARRLAAIAVPFGAAASPDLTILPVFLAASAVGVGAVVGVLTTFSIITLATFVTLTVAATLAGYQIQGEWLEENGNTLTAIVLLVIGIAVYVGL
jgi:hypothetical protein